MIVDDSAANRLLVRTIINRAGYEASECESGKACLDYCSRELPDMVLLDVMMPELSGIDVCRELRKIHSPEALPIIMVTTRTESADLAEGLEAGASDYVTKPVDRVVLLARVENQLARSRAQRELREMERRMSQRVKLETVGQFAAGVAHNFNNILGTVWGAAQLWQRAAAPERAKRCMELVTAAVESGRQLTAKMNTLMCSAREDRSTESAPLLETLRRAAARPELGERIVCRCELAPDLEGVEIAVRNFSDVIGNVIDNALDALPRGGEIRIKADWDAGHKLVLLSVRDNGCGMKAEVLERVFEPFFTTKNLDTCHGISMRGNGLGMWNVYNLIKMAGGEIEVASWPEQGTEVSMRLPPKGR